MTLTSMPACKAILAATAAFICALAIPGESLAAPKALPTKVIATGDGVTGPVLGISQRDEAVVIAAEYLNDTDPFNRLFSTVRRADGSFAPAQELGRGSSLLPPPAVAFTSAGDSLVSWCGNGDCSLARRSLRRAGGLFSAPISWNPADCVGDAQSVAYAANGAPTVACRGVSGTAPNNNRLVVLSAPSIDGLFSTEQVLVDASPDTNLRSAVDVGPTGIRAVAWGEKRSSELTLKVAVAPAGAGFGTPRSLLTIGSSAASLGSIDVAVLADGRAVVAYRERRSAGAYVRSADGTGVFSIPLTSAARFSPQVERDGRGGLLAWTEKRRDNDDSPVDLTIGSVGTAATPLIDQQSLDRSVYDLSVSALTVAANGAAAIARTSPNGLGATVAAAWIRPAGATAFTGPHPFASSTSTGGDISAAVDRHGSLLATWLQGESLMIGGLDAAGPELSGLSVPPRLKAGATGSFSIRAIDPAGVKRVTWSFGDRQTATGTAARHSFRGPGRYRVEVTATDGAGQESKASRTVRVSR